ncbi:MAG: 3-phosphoshikimate 1-carboxyvinyltransferase [Tannerella sp.]|jgi:3-phosphoshikimate 1-carboxyvinyltransferase|nr:3-phosphoshikimate 1-carboxyvinyltransferase [Tannerella sp.]
MKYHITAPFHLKEEIILPSSKSISNRVLIINNLSDFPKHIDNISVCDDTNVMINALTKNQHDINIKAAGTAMRFLTAYFACMKGKWILTGTERMKNRPIKILVDALCKAGACIEYVEKEGFPPLRIKGQTLMGGEVVLDGSVSSQYISALLLMAPIMTNGLRLHLKGEIISKPYIRLTINLMRRYGVIVYEDNQIFTVPPQQYSCVNNFSVEPDWSSASYWYEMVALSRDEDAEVKLPGLRQDSLQGDSNIVQLFDLLGVNTTFTSSGAVLSKCKPTARKPFVYDFVSMPDMAQTAAVTCCMLNIPFMFSGLQSLKIKETDRLEALKTELLKLGFPLYIHEDKILAWLGKRIKSEDFPVINTYEDHRMAMSFTPVSLILNEGLFISNPKVVSKSYPKFWNDIKSSGFKIDITD